MDSPSLGFPAQLRRALTRGDIEAFLDLTGQQLPGQPGNATRKNYLSSLRTYLRWAALERPTATAIYAIVSYSREGEMTTIQDQIRRELEAQKTTYEQAQVTREQRARDVHSARRSQQIEGGDISAYAQHLSQQYIDGKLTTAEMREKLLEHHGVTVK